eukprot:Unigene4969_Nuclearia_a/m.15207 Unigene4969_Nuclearia_a/g.15207  ORF Unigene4969_Nuclearia_a/g.15207 Unigene4969_Nuclearia_a/m.15207 type:complete len:344 (-) Unigene4969_Nuclearia_a:1842-2873(-)
MCVLHSACGISSRLGHRSLSGREARHCRVGTARRRGRRLAAVGVLLAVGQRVAHLLERHGIERVAHCAGDEIAQRVRIVLDRPLGVGVELAGGLVLGVACRARQVVRRAPHGFWVRVGEVAREAVLGQLDAVERARELVDGVGGVSGDLAHAVHVVHRLGSERVALLAQIVQVVVEVATRVGRLARAEQVLVLLRLQVLHSLGQHIIEARRHRGDLFMQRWVRGLVARLLLQLVELLAHGGKALLVLVEVGLDLLQCIVHLARLVGERERSRVGEVVDRPVHVALGRLDALYVGLIAVDLALQVPHRLGGLARRASHVSAVRYRVVLARTALASPLRRVHPAR